MLFIMIEEAIWDDIPKPLEDWKEIFRSGVRTEEFFLCNGCFEFSMTAIDDFF